MVHAAGLLLRSSHAKRNGALGPVIVAAGAAGGYRCHGKFAGRVQAKRDGSRSGYTGSAGEHLMS